MSRMQDREKEAIVELGSGGMLYRGKSAVEWYTDKGSEKHSKGEG